MRVGRTMSTERRASSPWPWPDAGRCSLIGWSTDTVAVWVCRIVRLTAGGQFEGASPAGARWLGWVGHGGQVVQPVAARVSGRGRSRVAAGTRVSLDQVGPASRGGGWCGGGVRRAATRLVIAVGPPSAQCSMWWPSHQAAGRSQPGNAQPRSRAISARRIPDRNGVAGPPDVQGLPGRAEQDGDELGVAGDPPGRLRGDRAAPAELRRPQPGAESLPVEGDGDLRALATGLGQVPGGEGAAGQFDQPVRLPSGRAAGIRAVGGGRGRGGERVQRGAEHRRPLRIEPAPDDRHPVRPAGEGQFPGTAPPRRRRARPRPGPGSRASAGPASPTPSCPGPSPGRPGMLPRERGYRRPPRRGGGGSCRRSAGPAPPRSTRPPPPPRSPVAAPARSARTGRSGPAASPPR